MLGCPLRPRAPPISHMPAPSIRRINPSVSVNKALKARRATIDMIMSAALITAASSTDATVAFV